MDGLSILFFYIRYLMSDQKEKSVEWRVFLTPFENKQLVDAAKKLGIPAHRKQVIMSVAFTHWINSLVNYGKESTQ